MRETWTEVFTNKLTKGNVVKPFKVQNFVKNVKRKSYEDLQKTAEASFKEKVAREENLIQAFEDKKLKSKTLIKEAKALKKTKEKDNKATAKKEEQSK